MLIYHASKEIVEVPEIRKTRFTKDLSWGFYCTNNFAQAVRWANRGDGEPRVNHFEYTPDQSLKILTFEKMADDTVWNFVNDFLAGTINRKQFWVLAEFKHPTHQISFHTEAALQCLKFVKCEVVHD